jgi:DNA-binding NtrC family response regulator
MKPSILVVDDEHIFRRETKLFLQEEGYDVGEAGSGEEALDALTRRDWDVLLLDLALPKMSGLEVLQQVHERSPDTLVIVVTAFASLESAVQALRLGAFDYLTKPLRFEDLLIRLSKISEHRELLQENRLLKRMTRERSQFGRMIGESAAIRDVFEQIRQLECADVTTLITGESGVGKELVARALHDHSPQRERPFLAVNVGAIPDTLLESQLFGHKRGAFTGASQAQAGLFQAARGGTVFLDEIGELPLALQPRLLRAIEEKEILPLGATQPQKADFRLVTATHRNLEQMVREGSFREDLYYRLNVFQIRVPPLRERLEDIPLLANHFVTQFSTQFNKQVQGFEREAMQALMQAPWPGNIRELRNVVERAVLLVRQARIPLSLLPFSRSTRSHDSLLLKDVLEQAERQHIQRVLELTDNSKEEAARMLGLSLATLYRRLEKYQP